MVTETYQTNFLTQKSSKMASGRFILERLSSPFHEKDLNVFVEKHKTKQDIIKKK